MQLGVRYGGRAPRERTGAGHKGPWYGVEFVSYFKKSFSRTTEETNLLKNFALEH